jgi:hypothetical protein
MGIVGQVQQLIAKIDETWDNTVSIGWNEFQEAEEERLNNAGQSVEDFHKQFYKVYYSEQEKGLHMCRQLEKDLRNYEIKTFAAAARKLQAKAREILSGQFSCTQCQAPLTVQANFYRSYYQVCEYCQTTNTFEPGTIARNIEGFALHPLAEEKALDAYWLYEDILRRYKAQQADGHPTITKDEVMQAYTTYVDTYLNARIAIIPDYKNRYEKDREAKLKFLLRYEFPNEDLRRHCQ